MDIFQRGFFLLALIVVLLKPAFSPYLRTALRLIGCQRLILQTDSPVILRLILANLRVCVGKGGTPGRNEDTCEGLYAG